MQTITNKDIQKLEDCAYGADEQGLGTIASDINEFIQKLTGKEVDSEAVRLRNEGATDV